MQAHGSDRVRVGDDGRRVISSRYPKGWQARTPRTLTSREHPGTAILWDEQWFEVTAIEPLAAGERYVLEPWPDAHAIRISDQYDEESERRREEQHHSRLRREKGRKTANLLGMFTGQLPAAVQEQLASELGLLAPKLTLLSLIPQFVFIVFVAYSVSGSIISGRGIPVLPILAAAYFVIENLVRFNMAFSSNRPMGSAIGMFVYLVSYPFTRRKGAVSPFAPERGTSILTTEAPPDVALRDAITTRAPLMTLLPPPEQDALRTRYGYDYRESATTVAFIILVFAAAGVVTSWMTLSRGPSLSALMSLLVAAPLAAEQLWRLVALRKGPVGSVLAFIARPFVAKLLR
jgi:hypothetical protein